MQTHSSDAQPYHSFGNAAVDKVLCDLRQPNLEFDHMERVRDAEASERLPFNCLLQQKPIHPVLLDGRVVLAELLRCEECAHVVDRPLIHRRLLRSRRRLVLRSRHLRPDKDRSLAGNPKTWPIYY